MYNSYFNTVGSKDGWTPSNFVSSKTKKQKNGPTPQQRPEDFMDDEDIAEVEESRHLENTGSFARLGSTEDDTLRRGTFVDFLRSSGDTMGVELLRKMGWRDGQGIGPKVRRKARLADEDGHRVTDGEEAHLFAPENSHMISLIRKNDRKGLGFAGESRLEDATKLATKEDSHENETLTFNAQKSKKKVQAQRGGFGVGILNDDGSGDEDAYPMGPKISYNRTVGDEKRSKKRSGNGRGLTSYSNPLLRSKPVFISKKPAMSNAEDHQRRCHDGRLPLAGFVLIDSFETQTTERTRSYPPPTIPPDWVSSKTSVGIFNQKPSTDIVYQSSADLARSSTLSPSTRATLLGERALPGKSIFDYLTPSARNRIAYATQNLNLPAALNEGPPPGHGLTHAQRKIDVTSLIPSLDSTIAVKALGRGIGGWMPYAEDPLKRARYRLFLEIRAGLQGSIPARADGMSTEDWVKEMQEFANAAQIFKPMTGMMATRFMSSTSTTPDGSKGFLAKDSGPETLTSDTVSKPADPAEEAARLGMYGPMTRSTTQFYPTRLLCKRFNVKPPHHVQLDPGSGSSLDESPSLSAIVGTEAISEDRFKLNRYHTSAKNLELVGKKEMEKLMRESGRQTGRFLGEGVETVQRKTVLVDPEKNEALERERPGDAVFRAIFGSDSEHE